MKSWSGITIMQVSLFDVTTTKEVATKTECIISQLIIDTILRVHGLGLFSTEEDEI